jgi:PKD repeat protein
MALDKVNILFLAANPSNTPPLELIKEFNFIDEEIRKGKNDDFFQLQQKHAITSQQIQDTLLRFNPQILHFSGHGSDAGGLIFEDDQGQADEVSPAALAKLFGIINKNNNIRCVVLSACYSEKQAKAIAQHVDCVIGMRREVTDIAARKFGGSFYNALAHGQDVKAAFDHACLQLELEHTEEEKIPKIIVKRGIDPSQILFKPVLPDQDDKSKINWTKWGTVGGIAAAVITVVALILPIVNVPALAISYDPPNDLDVGEEVQFKITATGGSNSYVMYTWDFGDNSTVRQSSSDSVPHKYASPGLYNVTLTVRDSSGNTKSSVYQVIVHGSSNFSVQISHSGGQSANEPVKFYSTVTGGSPGYEYFWYFGDNATSQLANPTHKYDESGNYEVLLQVTDSKDDQAKDEFLMNLPGVDYPDLTADIKVHGTNTVELGEQVQFEAVGSGGSGEYDFIWFFGDGSNSSAMNPKHAYSVSDTYTVALEVHDKGTGTIRKAFDIIMVKPGFVEVALSDFQAQAAVNMAPICVGQGCDPCAPWQPWEPCTYGYVTGIVKNNGNIAASDCDFIVFVIRDVTDPIPSWQRPHMEYDLTQKIPSIEPGSSEELSMRVEFDYSGNYTFSGKVVCGDVSSNTGGPLERDIQLS